jgi:hypothetical protein
MDELKQKQWWTPVWIGLSAHPDAKHYRRMKNAVWLYVHLPVGDQKPKARASPIDIESIIYIFNIDSISILSH